MCVGVWDGKDDGAVCIRSVCARARCTSWLQS